MGAHFETLDGAFSRHPLIPVIFKLDTNSYLFKCAIQLHAWLGFRNDLTCAGHLVGSCHILTGWLALARVALVGLLLGHHRLVLSLRIHVVDISRVEYQGSICK